MRGPEVLSPALLATPCKVESFITVSLPGYETTPEIPVLGGTFSSSVDRELQDEVVMEFEGCWKPENPWDPLECKGQVCQLFVDVTPAGKPLYRVNMGFFVHHEGKMLTNGRVQLKAYSLLKRLADDPFDFPSSPLSGSTRQMEFQRLCSPHVSVVVESGNSRLPGGLAWGFERLKAVEDLCVATGQLRRMENDGQLHVYDERSLRSSRVAYSFEDLVLASEPVWDHEAPNTWTAFGGQEDDSAKRWSASVQVRGGVMDPSQYGVVRERFRVDSAAGRSDVLRAANEKLAASTVRSELRTFKMVPDFRLEVWDVLDARLDRGVGRSILSGRVRQFSWPLSGEAQSGVVDVEVLKW